MNSSFLLAFVFLACFVLHTSCSQKISIFLEPEVNAMPEIAVQVVEVKTFGAWKKGEENGDYRLILEAHGWEELRYRAILERIASVNPSEGGNKVVWRKELIEPFYGYEFQGYELKFVEDQWKLRFRFLSRVDDPDLKNFKNLVYHVQAFETGEVVVKKEKF